MNKLRQLISSISDECAVPENIRTPPTEGTGISWGWGFSETKNLKKRMKLNSNFQRGGGGGGGVLEKIPSVGEVWIFSGTTQLDRVKWLLKSVQTAKNNLSPTASLDGL